MVLVLLVKVQVAVGKRLVGVDPPVGGDDNVAGVVLGSSCGRL